MRVIQKTDLFNQQKPNVALVLLRHDLRLRESLRPQPAGLVSRSGGADRKLCGLGRPFLLGGASGNRLSGLSKTQVSGLVGGHRGTLFEAASERFSIFFYASYRARLRAFQ